VTELDGECLLQAATSPLLPLPPGLYTALASPALRCLCCCEFPFYSRPAEEEEESRPVREEPLA